MDHMERASHWTPTSLPGGVPNYASSLSRASDRASEAEREAVLATVRRQTVAGRLSLAEFSERTDEALAARTVGELAAVLRGLPQQQSPSQRLPRRAPFAFLPGPLIVLLIVLALIGLASTHGWVLLPLIWLGWGLAGRRRWSHHRRARSGG